MTNDGSHTYTYDAENRITAGAGVTYTYDADGRRVKKSSGTNYWYGPGGSILAETDSSGNWTNYIFFAGQRLARNVPQAHKAADIKYYITDHLHSTAMFVDKAGTTSAIQDDNDFYPWGGVVTGVGKTTSTNHYKFTAKERDTESQLDYFGARYYANATGRFMSPDWAAKPVTVPYAQFGDPQSLNLYSYVRNSPIVRIDYDGHFDDPFGTFSPGASNIQSSYSDTVRVKTITTTMTWHLPSLDGTTPGPTITSVQEDVTIWQVGVPGTMHGTFRPRHLNNYERENFLRIFPKLIWTTRSSMSDRRLSGDCFLSPFLRVRTALL